MDVTDTSKDAPAFKKNRQSKRDLYERISSSSTILASQIHADEVEVLFNPEFINIPKPNQAGRKIGGTTVDEVLGHIIDQMRPVEFPIQSAEDFNKIYQEKIRKSNQDTLEECVEMLEIIFKDIVIDGRDTVEQIKSFTQAQENVKKVYLSKCMESSKKPFPLWIPLLSLLEQLAGNAPVGLGLQHVSALHRALAYFWMEMLKSVLQGPTTERSMKYSALVDKHIMFYRSGDCHFQFEMNISDDFLRQKCAYARTTDDGPKGDALTSTDDSDYNQKPAVKKRVMAKPDLCGFTRIYTMKDGKQTMASLRNFLVAEFKGSRQTIYKERLSDIEVANHGCPSYETGGKDVTTVHSESASESSSKPKTSKLADKTNKRKRFSDSWENLHEQVHADGMSSQHFLELLCCLKHQIWHAEAITKCFGIYVVNHRFYVTCLALVCKPHLHKVLLAPIMGQFLGSKEQEDYWNHPVVGLRMVSTDYLDMTNPVHMEAALKFIAYLSTCDD